MSTGQQKTTESTSRVSVRVQIRMTQAEVRAIDDFCEELATTRTQLFKLAVAHLKWSAGEISQGRRVVSVDESGSAQREAILPMISPSSSLAGGRQARRLRSGGAGDRRAARGAARNELLRLQPGNGAPPRGGRAAFDARPGGLLRARDAVPLLAGPRDRRTALHTACLPANSSSASGIFSAPRAPR